jgi:hypothetical protein
VTAAVVQEAKRKILDSKRLTNRRMEEMAKRGVL